MGNYVNLAVKTCHKGHHYEGITLHPGVDISIKPAGCGVPLSQIEFANTQTKPLVFVEGITGGDIDAETPCPQYLQIVAG